MRKTFFAAIVGALMLAAINLVWRFGGRRRPQRVLYPLTPESVTFWRSRQARRLGEPW